MGGGDEVEKLRRLPRLLVLVVDVERPRQAHAVLAIIRVRGRRHTQWSGTCAIRCGMGGRASGGGGFFGGAGMPDGGGFAGAAVGGLGISSNRAYESDSELESDF